jgi:hypothetical protein
MSIMEGEATAILDAITMTTNLGLIELFLKMILKYRLNLFANLLSVSEFTSVISNIISRFTLNVNFEFKIKTSY